MSETVLVDHEQSHGYIIWDKAVQNFRGVNFQFGLKINATYSGDHSDIKSLEL